MSFPPSSEVLMQGNSLKITARERKSQGRVLIQKWRGKKKEDFYFASDFSELL